MEDQSLLEVRKSTAEFTDLQLKEVGAAVTAAEASTEQQQNSSAEVRKQSKAKLN